MRMSLSRIAETPSTWRFPQNNGLPARTHRCAGWVERTLGSSKKVVSCCMRAPNTCASKRLTSVSEKIVSAGKPACADEQTCESRRYRTAWFEGRRRARHRRKGCETVTNKANGKESKTVQHESTFDCWVYLMRMPANELRAVRA